MYVVMSCWQTFYSCRTTGCCLASFGWCELLCVSLCVSSCVWIRFGTIWSMHTVCVLASVLGFSHCLVWITLCLCLHLCAPILLTSALYLLT